MLQLFLQSPHGTPQNTSGPFDHIFISRTAFKDRISVICGNLIQTAVYDTVSLFLRKLCPVQSLFSDFRRKFFQCHMHDISHIHSPELILCTFCNLQAILQKMCKCTGRKTLQPGSTVRGNFSIEDLCHCFSDLIWRSFWKRCLCKLFYKDPVFRALKIPAVQFLEDRIILVSFSCKPSQEIIQADSRKLQ